MKFTSVFAAAFIAASATTATAQNATDWGGFYAGVSVSSVSLDSNFGTPGLSLGGNGTGLGIMLGYNHALSPNFIVGGELTYGFAQTYYNIATGSVEDEASARLRAGYVMGDTLIYGAIGYAQANTVLPPSVKEKSDGTVVAIGLEHMLKSNLTIRVEYSHAEYSDFILLGPVWEDNTDALTIGVAYKF